MFKYIYVANKNDCFTLHCVVIWVFVHGISIEMMNTA